jgi:hypothetical protein
MITPRHPRQRNDRIGRNMITVEKIQGGMRMPIR